ncbi:MAG: DUF1957 domain-containing protein [Planctomycetes bacterium]|jgi:1,4-alpha-glucan branching enzyme|nr:DUF1957 domain-containing protein [Planctomycetota bacterium]
MPEGYLLLVLHAHLPFVRHPEDPHFLEERWLFEAITETYIPLLTRLEHLVRDGVRTRLTMTWSPPLCEMLVDPLLQSRYRLHVARLLELAEQEVYAKAHGPFAEAARMYRDHLRYCLTVMERFHGNILTWVCQLRDAGVLEPITCGATHGFLPLMLTSEAQRAQIAVAVANYRKHFGAEPKGIWLPECGYTPGVEHLLKQYGIRYFFVDTHGIYYGTPRPRYGVYAPVYTDSGVAAYARDPESSRSVWSAESGYPGDALYREFYRDLGYDGHYDYVRNFLHPDGVRRNLGLKYHAVTGKVQLHEKAPYLPTPAFARAMDHGGDFVRKRIEQSRHLSDLLGRAPLIVSPYDAELFGHWWYEGPQFIESIFRSAQASGHALLPVSGAEHLNEFPINQVITPSASSWGDAGYNGVWLNPANDWIYRHLHAAEERMVQMARRHPKAEGWQKRALNQMARELLLAQSSDWAFIMTTGTTVPYAIRRTRDHVNRFTGLFDQVASGHLHEDSIREIEWRDSVFQEIDYRVYA